MKKTFLWFSTFFLLVQCSSAFKSGVKTKKNGFEDRTKVEKKIVFSDREGEFSKSKREEEGKNKTFFKIPRIYYISGREAKKLEKKIGSLKEDAYLYIETDPADALIYVDDKEAGKGVFFLKTKDERFRKIKIEKFGYKTLEGFVQLKEREVTKLLIKLKEIGGNLTVLSEPLGAEIYFDRNYMGKTPETLRDINPGTYLLSLKSGAWSWSGNVTIKKGETSIISMQIGEVIATKKEKAREKPKEDEKVLVIPQKKVEPPPLPVHKEEKAVLPPPPVVEKEKEKEGKVKFPAGYKPDCEKICEKFSSILNGSESVREPVAKQCIKRCAEEEDYYYTICAWKAQTMDDVLKCSQMK